MHQFLGVNDETIKLTLIDPINGAGTIAITDNSTFHAITLYNFIATRTKQGNINKLYLILIDKLDNNVIVTGVLERQQGQ